MWTSSHLGAWGGSSNIPIPTPWVWAWIFNCVSACSAVYQAAESQVGRGQRGKNLSFMGKISGQTAHCYLMQQACHNVRPQEKITLVSCPRRSHNNSPASPLFFLSSVPSLQWFVTVGCVFPRLEHGSHFASSQKKDQNNPHLIAPILSKFFQGQETKVIFVVALQ